MAISDTIQSMYENVGDVYDTITNVTLPEHKNIENIPRTIRDSYLEIINNGINVIYDNWEKVTGEGTSLTLTPTEEAPMEIVYKGNTYQYSTSGKNMANANPTSFEYPASTNTIKNLGSINLTSGTTYYFSYTIENATTSNTRNTPFLQISGGNKQYENTGTNYNLTTGRKSWTYNCQTTGEYTFGFWVNGSNANVTIDQIMISTSNDTTYEPYTNGASPNPDYPQPIQVVSGDNSIEVCGKNLFSISSAITDVGTQYVISNPNSIRVYRTTTGVYSYAYIDEIIKAGTYAFSCVASVVGGAKRVLIQHKVNGSYTTLVNMETTMSSTFTLNTDEELRFIFYANGSGTSAVGDITYSNIQLEKGNQATSYEPYTGASYPINLPVENLLESTITEKTTNNITFTPVYTNNKLDYINVNGTANADTRVPVTEINVFTLEQGKEYTLTGCPSGGSSSTYSLYMNLTGQVDTGNGLSFTRTGATSQTNISIDIKNGTICNNLKFKPMIQSGLKKNTYTPYGTTPIWLGKIPNTDYGDKIDKSSGKNVLDLSQCTFYRCILNSDNSLTSNISNSYFCSIYADYLKSFFYEHLGDTITFSVGQTLSNKRVSITISGTRIGGQTYQEIAGTNGNNYVTGTIANDFTEITGIELRFNRTNDRQTDTTSVFTNFMLNLGETTPYEPYGTSWYLKKEIGKYIITSFISKSSTTNNQMFNTTAISNIKKPSSGADLINLFSTHGIAKAANTIYLNDTTGVGINVTGSISVGFGLSSSLTTLELANTWVASNNIELRYPLETPTYTLIEGELLNQLEAIKMSYEGQTNLSQTNNDLPFILNPSALKKV